MNKLINYANDYDNVDSNPSLEEIENCMKIPYILEEDSGQHVGIALKVDHIMRVRNDEKNFIDIPSSMDIRKMVTTDHVSGFITTENDFYMIYSDIDHFEKIASNIKDCITGSNTFVLITLNNTPLFVNAVDNGHIIDDDYWETDNIYAIYTIKNKFVIHTTNNCLYAYDGCANTSFSFEELDHIVQDVIVTLDTITVLTTCGRVWVYGNKKHGAYITNGRGFIDCISNAVQVVRTVRAGAILTADHRVWAWGDIRYGGSPRPNWVKNLPDCIPPYPSFASKQMGSCGLGLTRGSRATRIVNPTLPLPAAYAKI
jgi:hypothetical protein